MTDRDKLLGHALACITTQAKLAHVAIACTGMIEMARLAEAFAAILDDDDLAHYAEHHYWRQDHGYLATDRRHDD